MSDSRKTAPQTRRRVAAGKSRPDTISPVTETALQDSERWRVLFHSTPSAVFVCDRAGIIQDYNRRAEQFWGRSPLRGDPRERYCGSLKLFLPDGTLLPHADSPIVGVLNTGVPVSNVDVLIERPDGSRIAVLVNFAALRNTQDEIIGAITSFNDITEHKQRENALRDSEQRFARFMENLPGLAWIKDSRGRYIYVNQAAAEAFGHSRAEIDGKTDDAFFPPQTAARFKHNDGLARLTPGGIQTVETLTHPDGSEHHSLVGKFQIPAAAEQETMIGGIAVDISDRVRAERALKEADHRKDEFIATLAHELRNPLMPLGVAAEILNSSSGSGGHAPEIAQIVKRQVDNLSRLVDDLLEISRITLGKIVLRKTEADLRTIIHNSIEITRPHMQHARHQLEVTLPDEAVVLQADSMRVTQIIANLLNNAAKYTPDGGKISLSAQVEGEQVVVRVRDNGIGIAPEHLPHIFDMFAQPNNSAQNTQSGMGIGLSLARRLAELHGGSLSAASEGVNRGSEITLRIPLRSVDAGIVPTAPVAEVSDTVSNSLRILIADDNHGAADIMAIALRGMRARVRVVYDGAAAVAVTAEFKPHIVFMDIGMSGIDGHEAARRIRAVPENKDMVLIAVSGWGQDDMRRRSEEAGFNHHAVKPLGLQELRRLVHEYAQFRAKGR